MSASAPLNHANARPEVLVVAMARMLRGLRHVAVGAASPIPATAALLAREQATADAPMRVTILGSMRHADFTNGGVELFDMAGQGRIDAFFLGGGQIDGQANINLVGTGDYPNVDVRWPGSFGSAYLYYVVPRVILFREEHTRRVLVPKVDFVSAPGSSSAGIFRRGGPYALVTGKAVFMFDAQRQRFRLESVHPGCSLEEVRDLTGFEFDNAADTSVADTATPTVAEMILMHGGVRAAVAETYPRFAARLI